MFVVLLSHKAMCQRLKDRRKIGFVIMGCDRGGTYKDRIENNTSEEKGKRGTRTGTRLIGCPFEIWGKRNKDGWIVDTKDLSHNHEPSKDILGHPYARRFSVEETKQIKE